MSPRVDDMKPDYAHTLSYNPSLDGIRAVAILGVLFAHFGVAPFRGGGQGVDVFFVLSGYLIARAILRDPHFSARRFYWHRLVRLAPALIFLCIIYFIVGWLLLDHSQVIGDIVTSVTYISNWTRAFGSGYPQYLGQTWSLSIEEQFYLVAPMALLMIRGRLSAEVGAMTMAGAAVACIVYRTAALHQGMPFDRVYNGTDTHCDGILFGIMLGQMEVNGLFVRIRRQAAAGGSIALGVILLMFCATDWGSAISAVVDIAALWLIVAVTTDQTSTTSRILSAPPLVRLGQVSYSLYLWHYPIFMFLYYHFRLTPVVQIMIGIPLSIATAMLSHTFVERPALRLRDRPSRIIQRRLGLLGASATIALIAVGSGSYLKEEIIDVVSPPPLRIEAYGPTSSVKGEGFNVQPNGESIIWAKTSTRLPRGSTAEWHDEELQVSVSSRGLSIVAPPDLVNSAGHQVVTIRSAGAVVASLDILITE